jgi:hypothetical protein
LEEHNQKVDEKMQQLYEKLHFMSKEQERKNEWFSSKLDSIIASLNIYKAKRSIKKNRIVVNYDGILPYPITNHRKEGIGNQ